MIIIYFPTADAVRSALQEDKNAAVKDLKEISPYIEDYKASLQKSLKQYQSHPSKEKLDGINTLEKSAYKIILYIIEQNIYDLFVCAYNHVNIVSNLSPNEIVEKFCMSLEYTGIIKITMGSEEIDTFNQHLKVSIDIIEEALKAQQSAPLTGLDEINSDQGVQLQQGAVGGTPNQL